MTWDREDSLACQAYRATWGQEGLRETEVILGTKACLEWESKALWGQGECPESLDHLALEAQGPWASEDPQVYLVSVYNDLVTYFTF